LPKLPTLDCQKLPRFVDTRLVRVFNVGNVGNFGNVGNVS